MSAAEILNEIPKLKPEERRAIASRVFELEKSDDIEWATEATEVAFQELDKIEDGNASTSPR